MASHPFDLSAQPYVHIPPYSAEFGSHKCPSGLKYAQKTSKIPKIEVTCLLAAAAAAGWYREPKVKKADFWNAIPESAPTLASHPYMYVGEPHGCGRVSLHQSAAMWSVVRTKCFEKAENKNKYTRYGAAHLPPDPGGPKMP